MILHLIGNLWDASLKASLNVASSKPATSNNTLPVFTTATHSSGEYKKELFGLRFQQATGQLENTARIRQVRKTIARIKTVIRERELNQ